MLLLTSTHIQQCSRMDKWNGQETLSTRSSSTMRNPVARIVSTFNYHRHLTMKERHTEHHIRQSEKVFLDYFLTSIQSQTDFLPSEIGQSLSPCAALAKTILQGKGFDTDTSTRTVIAMRYFRLTSDLKCLSLWLARNTCRKTPTH